ncbi:STAS domain-containing protein [Nonomuraea zeae]|uniref:STAS domain-containing protein n=1 Tax=Nonomuraea zeae TaxID=1642303 RepID=A0A5S4GRI3_9ACTN|nr:STAS domain-containing protein [Nonomuraea zeae]TMR35104.1 STAS domain-containing protein [Nonomuraea zeae]
MDALFHDGSLCVFPVLADDGSLTLRLEGSIDRTTSPAWRSALMCATGREGDVVVDMADVEFIDVAGLRELVSVALSLPAGRRLRVRRLAPAMAKVVRLAGWDGVFGLVLEEAGRP